MGPEDLHRLCRRHRGAEQTQPFGPETTVYKVAGKMFALFRAADEPARISLKCEPALAEQLRADHPEIVGGWHLNKRHWNTVHLDGALPEAMVADMIEDSYDLVVASLPKARRRGLLWPGDRGSDR